MSPRIGLALGSGAARGWAHIGVLEALQAEGIEPHIVTGCSMGALVGAAQVCGVLPGLKDFAEKLTRRGVVALLDVGLSGGGLINGAAIVQLLRDLGVNTPIEQCATPFAAVATNLETGREIWLREGPIEDMVRASISIPGVFNPARHAGAWLGDGALVNPVPVSLCRAMGAEIIIAVHVNSGGVVSFGANTDSEPKTPPEFVRNLIEQMPASMRAQAGGIVASLFPPPAVSPGYFEVLFNAINIMEDQITRSRLAGEPPDILLTPQLASVGPLEFHRAKDAIDEGRTAMQQAMPALKRLLS
ncbi:MAG: patatin-like phospholipase family protein [Hyphomonadaceae bacterium]|nr:patatin-like phospholipase family protein [Hyphomonadaceae bacterium]